jgi:hypothetical protein
MAAGKIAREQRGGKRLDRRQVPRCQGLPEAPGEAVSDVAAQSVPEGVESGRFGAGRRSVHVETFL